METSDASWWWGDTPILAHGFSTFFLDLNSFRLEMEAPCPLTHGTPSPGMTTHFESAFVGVGQTERCTSFPGAIATYLQAVLAYGQGVGGKGRGLPSKHRHALPTCQEHSVYPLQAKTWPMAGELKTKDRVNGWQWQSGFLPQTKSRKDLPDHRNS